MRYLMFESQTQDPIDSPPLIDRTRSGTMAKRIFDSTPHKVGKKVSDMDENEEITMMLASIQEFEPDCQRSPELLRAIITRCHECRNHEHGNGCTTHSGGDLWGYWRKKLVSGFCDNWSALVSG